MMHFLFYDGESENAFSARDLRIDAASRVQSQEESSWQPACVEIECPIRQVAKKENRSHNGSCSSRNVNIRKAAPSPFCSTQQFIFI